MPFFKNKTSYTVTLNTLPGIPIPINTLEGLMNNKKNCNSIKKIIFNFNFKLTNKIVFKNDILICQVGNQTVKPTAT